MSASFYTNSTFKKTLLSFMLRHMDKTRRGSVRVNIGVVLCTPVIELDAHTEMQSIKTYVGAYSTLCHDRSQAVGGSLISFALTLLLFSPNSSEWAGSEARKKSLKLHSDKTDKNAGNPGTHTLLV